MSAVYDRIQAITDVASRRKAIKNLSADNKKEYVRHQTNLRQRRYMSDPVKRTNAYVLNAIYKNFIKALHPEKARQNRIKHAQYMREYRARKVRM